MYELIKAGGWLMVPIVACSIIAMAVILERVWVLQRSRVIPKRLVEEVWALYRNHQLNTESIQRVGQGSPLGRILAAGLLNRHHAREIMKESIEDTGRQVVHQLERYLNTLGTIASVTPLLGLLGTVFGMIDVFGQMVGQGIGGDPSLLAGGINKALITTAAGLSVGIPALICYRFLSGHIDALVITMEEEALKMVEIMHGVRERDRLK